MAAREARRKQAKRRQQLVGAGLVIALLVGGGAYVAIAGSGGDGGKAKEAGSANPNPSSDDQRGDGGMLADDSFLLDATGAKKLAAGTWTIAATAEGAKSPERSFSCQAQRFADSSGLRTWVRQFKNSTDTAVEYVELSSDGGAAQRAYGSVLSWLGSCVTPQQRLVGSWSANGLGDRAVVAVFAQPAGAGKARYRTLTVAGTGPATMVLEHQTTAAKPPAPKPAVNAAADALAKLCKQTRSTCPRSQVTTPALLPSTDEPAGFLSAIDLPIVAKVKEPWVGVEATTKPTDCGETTGPKTKPKRSQARTYLPVGAKVPTEFGVDTRVLDFGTVQQAGIYISQFAGILDRCKTSHSNVVTKRITKVGGEGGATGQTWTVKIGLDNGSTLTYRVGAARAGNRVAYVLFLSLKGLDVSDQDFAATVARAAHRALSFK